MRPMSLRKNGMRPECLDTDVTLLRTVCLHYCSALAMTRNRFAFEAFFAYSPTSYFVRMAL